MIQNLQSLIFHFEYNENTYVGINEKAENTLKQLWTAIGRNNFTDDRVDWLLYVAILPEDESNCHNWTPEQALEIAEKLNKLSLEWSCVRFMYEPCEMGFILMLTGFKSYIYKDIKFQIEQVTCHLNARISISPLFSQRIYDATQAYIDAVEGRYLRNRNK